jgi:AraC family transcriptional regulator
MIAATVFRSPSVSVIDYRCTDGPDVTPITERHRAFSVSYVRRGSFGYRTHGRSFDLVAGSVLIGAPGHEYICTHHHGQGDQCLSFHLAPEIIDAIGGHVETWQACALPPLPELIVLGELGGATADRQSDVGFDEVAMLLTARVVEVTSGRTARPAETRAQDRARMVDAAVWIDAHAHEPLAIGDVGREIGLSPFHFLRLFARVFGVTPHQYLIRCRVRRAARLLAHETHPISGIVLDVGFRDLSNFVRTFHRAAGVSPRAFRHAAQRPCRPSEARTL